MAATTGYQAGTESNDAVVSYAQETVYGVLPAVAFQNIRFTGETLAGTKQRNRPGEILNTGEVAAAVTTQEAAGGNVNFALSFGTFDDLLAGALNNDWGATFALNGSAGNISVSTAGLGGSLILTGPVGSFLTIRVGQWLRLKGFTQPALNNAYRVAYVDGAGTNVTLIPVTTTAAETPAGSAAGVRGCMLTNAHVFHSYTLQTKFGAGLYLRYPGSYVTAFTLSGGVGQFLSGSFTFMSNSEQQFTVDGSTGAALAAPSGRVHDPVAGFAGVYLNGQPISAVVDSFSISATDTGAKQEYGMGSATAQGQIMGLLEVKGTVKVYFKDFALYSMFKTETQGVISFVTRDPAGNAYAITILAANILNPAIDASGPSTAVMATFQLEGNPQIGGGTIQIDRLTSI